MSWTRSLPPKPSCCVHLCCGESSSAALGRSPLGFWWLDPAAVYALSLTLIAAVYIGFAVADGRPVVLAVGSGVDFHH